MPNVELHPPRPVPPFRKIAIGTWSRTYDPQVYGTMKLRMERALEFIERFRERTGKRLTVTHLVAKAAAIALERMPDANALLRLGRIYRRKEIAVFLQVAMTNSETGHIDLSGATIRSPEKLSLEALVDQTERQIVDVREEKDEALTRSRKLFSAIPGLCLHYVLRAVAFLLYTLNLDLTWAGVPKDGFGSIMVTNVGSLGLDIAYAPLVPWSRVPIVVAVGKVVDEAVVEDGKVVPGKVMRISATFDHRYIDGVHASVLARAVEEAFQEPEKFFASSGFEAAAASFAAEPGTKADDATSARSP